MYSVRRLGTAGLIIVERCPGGRSKLKMLETAPSLHGTCSP
jgi:hypothetical protein